VDEVLVVEVSAAVVLVSWTEVEVVLDDSLTELLVVVEVSASPLRERTRGTATATAINTTARATMAIQSPRLSPSSGPWPGVPVPGGRSEAPRPRSVRLMSPVPGADGYLLWGEREVGMTRVGGTVSAGVVASAGSEGGGTGTNGFPAAGESARESS
jgi:hypothetical protein